MGFVYNSITFFVSILIIFNSQHYIREKRNIEQNLSRMDIRFEKKPITDEKAFEPGSVNDNNDIPKGRRSEKIYGCNNLYNFT